MSAGVTSGGFARGQIVAGKYRLEALIGEGGMGSVWSAVHLGLGNHVAVKFILPAYAQATEARRRFDTEAKAAARLRSRHVVQVFDNGELQDGTLYIVMELLQGTPLDKRIAASVLSPPEAYAILAQTARAIDHAHSQGVVHRDLKPENVFLTHSPEEGLVVKVLDFGIAKTTFGDEASTTRTGSLLGTPTYMSPEQARGLRTVDHRVDIYALGMVTFTMLVGHPALLGNSLTDLLVRICTSPLPRLSEQRPGLPASLDAWLERACAREPHDRFGSARELAESFALAIGMSTQPVFHATPWPHVPSGAAWPTPVASPPGHVSSASHGSNDSVGSPAASALVHGAPIAHSPSRSGSQTHGALSASSQGLQAIPTRRFPWTVVAIAGVSVLVLSGVWWSMSGVSSHIPASPSARTPEAEALASTVAPRVIPTERLGKTDPTPSAVVALESVNSAAAPDAGAIARPMPSMSSSSPSGAVPTAAVPTRVPTPSGPASVRVAPSSAPRPTPSRIDLGF